MSKVTSKLQLTVPKAIADQYGIRPGMSWNGFRRGRVSAWS
jgi:bifunctional DNA-binding transcriptional regulator/antitoxin component of YhaV-PrlF toxin-antitoxin module